MQISTSSTAYATSGAQRMLAALLAQQNSASGQDLQSTQGPGNGPPPGGPPPGGDSAPSSRFSADTLSSLLSVQQQQPTSADLASQLISQVDSNGDGSLSFDEVKNALTGGSGAQTSSTSAASSPGDALTKALAKIDTNGDGQISSSELTSALDSFKATHKHGGHHHQTAGATPAATTETATSEPAATSTSTATAETETKAG